MKIKSLIALFCILIITSLINILYAAPVQVTKENLQNSFDELTSESGYEIKVLDDYITLCDYENTYKMNYSISDNKVSFGYETKVAQKMSYKTFLEKTDNGFILPILGYIAVSNIQGINYENAMIYSIFNIIGNLTTSEYIIYDDLNTEGNLNVEVSDPHKVILASQFGDRVMEYVNSVYSKKQEISDKYDTFKYISERKDVTSTSCTLSFKLDIDINKLKNISLIFKFNDLEPNKWYYTAAQYCYENGIILGTTETTFEPNVNLTRAMLVTILHRMEGSPKVNIVNKFSDVDQNKWYAEAIKWASKYGIVHGYDGQGKFGPNDNITREQLAVILNNYATYKGKAGTVIDGLSKFPDSNEISGWAKEGVKWAVGRGIINGSQGKIVPKGTATRAEAAAMIYNYCMNVK